MGRNKDATRYEPCILLRQHNTPCVAWFEDAIAYYGVPTAVFELYLLVNDVDAAAKVLQDHGWELHLNLPKEIGNALVETAQHRLTPPCSPSLSSNLNSKDANEPLNRATTPPHKKRPGMVTTVLLSASEWNFHLAEHYGDYADISTIPIFPTLPCLLDASISNLLRAPLNENPSLTLYLSNIVSYMYGHISNLKQFGFEKDLKYEHRQFHYDKLAGLNIIGLSEFIDRERDIKDALLKGQYELNRFPTLD